MFDPLSALTCISFAIGVCGFLATTISKMHEGVYKVKGCSDMLFHFNGLLKDGHLQLKAWRSIWINELQHEDGLYVYLWGQEGFDEVQNRLRMLHDLSIRIKTLLRRPSTNDSEEGISPDERFEWHRLLRQELWTTDVGADFNYKKLNLLRRIGFSLFDNTILQEKIGRFKSQVQGLDDYSTRSFRLLQRGDPNSKVSPMEVRKVAAIKRYIDRASLLGSSAFEFSRSINNSDVTLELTPPEEDDALDMWNESDDLHVDLIVISNNVPKRRAGRFRAVYGLRVQKSRKEILELLEEARLFVVDDIEVGTVVTKNKFWFELEPPSSRSRPFRNMLIDGVFTSAIGKSFDIERTDLIYGLAHWFVHFFNTPWTEDVCSCNVRQVRMLHSKTRHSLKAGRATAISHFKCWPIEVADQKLTLLGKTLAEVALAVPISLDLNRDELIYIVDSTPTTQAALLAALAHRYGRTTITKAIKYCLDPANADLKDFLPEHMEPFYQNVLQPLAKFHKIMMKHCNSKYGAITRHQEAVVSFYDGD